MVDISKIDTDRIDGLEEILNKLLSVGDLCYSLRTEKAGWLLCDGSSYSTTDYPDLFAVIQYTYGGSGDNFNVPNYQGMFLQMKGSSQNIGQKMNAGLPNITGTFRAVDTLLVVD